MAHSRLLKSWATPPASRPTASIFCDSRSWISSWRRSVTSAIEPMMRTGAPGVHEPGHVDGVDEGAGARAVQLHDRLDGNVEVPRHQRRTGFRADQHR